VKITLLDYGAGNLPSVERALQRLGAATVRVNSPEKLAAASAIVLPGVGHYAALIRALDRDGLRDALLQAIQKGVPFLGICLGLQALYQNSDEAPELEGLKMFPGAVRALSTRVKLPHMGWNQLQQSGDSQLLEGIADDAFFYFAHSYAACSDGSPAPEARASCTYGDSFVAVVERENLFAVQFHPEKSAAAGQCVLQNFLRIAA
jgi:imidazole glycerol phosphate synthase glutamine amidotransferase subunit